MDEFPFNLHRIDITAAICEMLEDSIAVYESRGLSINFSQLPNGVFVNADARLFRNVVINILENSVKYKHRERGQMEISAAVEGANVLLRFADDGPGVEAQMLPKILDVFYRADPSRNKTWQGGSGLGLAISAKIIGGMGGHIRAEPPPPGSRLNGLNIVISLPVSQGETI